MGTDQHLQLETDNLEQSVNPLTPHLLNSSSNINTENSSRLDVGGEYSPEIQGTGEEEGENPDSDQINRITSSNVTNGQILRFEETMEKDPIFLIEDEEQSFSDAPPEEINPILSEFARLLVLLRENTKLRDDFMKSRTTLSRNELDSRIAFDACWTNTIAPAFNNRNYKPYETFTQLVSNVDTSRPPAEERSGPSTISSIAWLALSLAASFLALPRSASCNLLSIKKARFLCCSLKV